MQKSNYYLFYHTLLLTGLRRSEFLALKWNALMPYFPRRRKMKMSAEGDENECEPYRSRTCDTLIKSHGVSNQIRKEVK